MSNLSVPERARIRALIAAELRDGERAIVNYCHDCCGCGCPPHHNYIGLPCIVVGRRDDVRFDRCLMCSTTWRTKDFRGDPTEVIVLGPAQRDQAFMRSRSG